MFHGYASLVAGLVSRIREELGTDAPVVATGGLARIFEPEPNLDTGIRYLKWLSHRFDEDLESVLAAYNAGEATVERFSGVPPYRETREYIRRIYSLLGLASAAGVE